ncbi:MAG: glutamyl-tRNA reductase [Rhodospirillales bacterium]|nr:glutamyl-tRNA reductase [Rhodospirillales bacterium]
MALPSASARLVVVGVNHRTSSVALRDRLFVADAEMPAFLGELRRAGIDQGLVMSTCDRIEVEAADPDPGAAAKKIVSLFVARAGLAADDLRHQLYVLEEGAALRQIFAVAAALDSQVIGEPQVLGQIKEAHRRSRAAGMVGSELEAALQAAYGTAKRVRSETAIGERPVSLASAAVQLARDVHGDLSRCGGLLIGPGEMGELMVEHLRAAGLRDLALAGPGPAQAAETARRLACHLVAFDALADALAQADLVVSAAGTGRHLITAAMMAGALERRRRRPVLVLDLGVPADVEPAVEALDGAFRYDLDDLERVAMSGRATREAAAAEAWAIVDAELAAFERDRAERTAVPAISALRRHFETERARALQAAGNDAARATELLVNRLLHGPSETLRQMAGAATADAPDRRRAEILLRRLFRLDDSAMSSGAAGDEEKKS